MNMQSVWGWPALGFLLLAGPALAQTPAQDVEAAMQGELTAQVAEGCENELVQYCSEVTPGEGRLLACLYAYGDKLSGQCQGALYDAAVRLERAVDAVAFVAAQCSTELDTLCANVQPGEGRIAQCLRANQSQLSPSCSQALTDVGVE
jgi:Cysteine rich repeat